MRDWCRRVGNDAEAEQLVANPVFREFDGRILNVAEFVDNLKDNGAVYLEGGLGIDGRI